MNEYNLRQQLDKQRRTAAAANQAIADLESQLAQLKQCASLDEGAIVRAERALCANSTLLLSRRIEELLAAMNVLAQTPGYDDNKLRSWDKVRKALVQRKIDLERKAAARAEYEAEREKRRKERIEERKAHDEMMRSRAALAYRREQGGAA